MLKGVFVFFLLFCSEASAIDALTIIEKTDKNTRKHANQAYDVEMDIYDDKGNSRKRFFTQNKLVQGKNHKSKIKFYKPSKIKGTAVLTHNEEASKTQWIYLPALRAIRQINNSNENDSFMGSDFSYSDIAGRRPEDDKHVLIEESDKFYLIESEPVDINDSYGKLELVVDKSRFVAIRVKFFDKDGNLLKTLKNKKIENIKGQYVVTEAFMENNLTGGKTIVKILNVDFSRKFNDRNFGINALKE